MSQRHRILGVIAVLVSACVVPHSPCSVTNAKGNSRSVVVSCRLLSLTEVKRVNGSEFASELDVSENRIKSLENHSFDGYENVEIINLWGNEIEKIEVDAFRRLKSLRDVRLSGNVLEAISHDLFTNCSDIQTVDLSLNRFSRVSSEYPFLASSTLTTLHLGQNALDNLPAKFFSELPNLTKVGLSKNHLTGLTRSTFEPLLHLSRALLDENPFICSCELSETVLLFQERKIDFVPAEIVCSVASEEMSISVFRDKNCNAETIAVRADDTSVLTEPPSKAGYTERNAASDEIHVSETATPNIEDKLITEEIAAGDEKMTEKFDFIFLNLSKIWDFVTNLGEKVDKLKLNGDHADRQSNLNTTEILLAALFGLVVIATLLFISRTTQQQNDEAPGSPPPPDISSQNETSHLMSDDARKRQQ